MTTPHGNPPPPPPMPSAEPPPASGGLQFDRAEFAGGDAAPAPGAAAAASASCATCQQPIVGTYYAAGDVVVCPACREQILDSMNGGSGALRMLRALAFGLAAGVAGALLWYAVTELTGYQIGLIAIVIGFAVGVAVRKGSNDRGGIAYQLLAVLLTYCSIVSTYVPGIYAELAKENDVPVLALSIGSVVFAFIAPVLMGLENIIGMLIIAFALWEAWRINKYRKIEFAGPFVIGGGGISAVPTPMAPTPPTAPPPQPSTT